MNLPPIDFFYKLPLDRWVHGCKPFVPTIRDSDSKIDFIDLKLSDEMKEYFKFQDEIYRDFYNKINDYLGLKK